MNNLVALSHAPHSTYLVHCRLFTLEICPVRKERGMLKKYFLSMKYKRIFRDKQ
jgi:hypothetical protein